MQCHKLIFFLVRFFSNNACQDQDIQLLRAHIYYIPQHAEKQVSKSVLNIFIKDTNGSDNFCHSWSSFFSQITRCFQSLDMLETVLAYYLDKEVGICVIAIKQSVSRFLQNKLFVSGKSSPFRIDISVSNLSSFSNYIVNAS